MCMIIVAGHLMVAPGARERYLASCQDVVEQARRTPGCLEFSIAADLLDPDRIAILERWESQGAVESFRGSGPSDDQTAVITSATVTEYDVACQRPLT